MVPVFLIMFLCLNVLCGFSMIYSMENMSLFSMPKDILKEHMVKPYLCLTAIGRLKQVDKSNNIYWGESFHRYCTGCATSCDNFACRDIAKNFQWSNKALVYFAAKNNEKMFQHVWCYYSETRDQAVKELLDLDTENVLPLPWLTYMDVYRGNYFSLHDVRVNRSCKLIEALRDQSIRRINTTVLLGKDFDVFVKDYRGEFTLLEYLCASIHWEKALEVLRFKTYTQPALVDYRVPIICPLGLAMHLALIYNNSVLCCALLKYVPDINYRYGQKRQTILHRAIIMSYSAPFIYGIIQAGAAVNVSDVKRRTPLYYAQKIKDKKLKNSIKTLLIMAGANRIKKKKWIGIKL